MLSSFKWNGCSAKPGKLRRSISGLAEVQSRDALHPVPHNGDQVATKEMKRIQNKLQNFLTTSESESSLFQILQAQAAHSEAGPLRRKAWTRDVDFCFWYSILHPLDFHQIWLLYDFYILFYINNIFNRFKPPISYHIRPVFLQERGQKGATRYNPRKWKCLKNHPVNFAQLQIVLQDLPWHFIS